MDWFVILTPLLVLAVVLLLGFAGCDLVFPLDPIKTLIFRIRVPSTLVIDQSQLRFLQPGSGTTEEVLTLDRSDDGPDTVVLSHLIQNPAQGTWTADARLQVSEGASQATDTGTGLFTLDSSSPDSSAAVFETSGSPATNDFKVLFTGLVPD